MLRHLMSKSNIDGENDGDDGSSQPATTTVVQTKKQQERTDGAHCHDRPEPTAHASK
jgi:hypothetical protein